jgi:hypothetical protein
VKRSTGLVRLIGRIGAVGIAGVFLALVALQFARIVGQNLTLAHTLRDVEGDVSALESKRLSQLRTIARLSDLHGAVPEIHERLHLVGDHEAIIYLKRTHAP